MDRIPDSLLSRVKMGGPLILAAGAYLLWRNRKSAKAPIKQVKTMARKTLSKAPVRRVKRTVA